MVELVGEEIVEVLAERRLHDYQRFVARTVVPERPASEIEHFDLVRASLRVADDLAVFVPFVIGSGAVGAPRLIVFRTGIGVPHAGEKVHELVGMFVSGEDRNRFVLAVVVQIADVLVFVTGDRSRELGTVEQRFVSVLIAVEQRIEGERIARVVAVHRGIGRRADRNRCVGRVADEDHQRREQHEIEHRAPFFMGEIYAHAERSQQGYYEEHEAGIDGQSQ